MPPHKRSRAESSDPAVLEDVREEADYEEPVEKERKRPAIMKRRTTLLVGNLPKRRAAVLEDELRGAFGRFGELKACEVIRDHDRKESRGFAFVTLRDGRDTERAKKELDGTFLRPAPPADVAVEFPAKGKGKIADSERRSGPTGAVGATEFETPLKVRWALDTHTLCVSDIGPKVTAEQLQEAFEQFGNILSCRIDREPPELNNHSKGLGFVEFSKKSNAAKVQQLLSDNMFIISNSPRPVRVEFAVDDGMDDQEGEPVDPSFLLPPPHFAVPGSLEFDFALRWRELSLAHSAEVEKLAELQRQEREIMRREQYDQYQAAFKKLQVIENPVGAAMRGAYQGDDEPGGGERLDPYRRNAAPGER
jgi:RNA recognition motif-containing protein